MREPKNLSEYTSRENAAKGLEDLAKDLREIAVGNTGDDTLVKWDINIRFWNPEWKSKAKRKR